MGIVQGDEWLASTRDAVQRSQSQMMGSTVFLGWICVALLSSLAWLGHSIGFLIGAVGVKLATVGWHFANYRRLHRWDRLEAKAAAEKTAPSYGTTPP